VPALSYQFVYNTQTSYTNTNFNFFKAALSSSGLLATFFASESVEDGTKQLNGTNIAQYVKLDLEYKKNWDLKYHNSLAFRSSIGIAVPYGNSTSMPFSRSYFIGGPNDLRAWKIYELGPGKEKTGLEFNVGNFKMLNSLEYRFDVLGSLKAAFFVDAGNIWDVSDSDLNDVDAKFTGLAALKNTPVGSGFGLRYDLSFLILRGDLGFKTYEPYIEEGSKWFQDLKPVLNIGINYPF
jgi:outer membrane protein assembly factor BamA